MSEEQEADRELGQILRRLRLDQAQRTKDHIFEKDPEAFYRIYRFDKRTVAALGIDEWNRRYGSEEDE